MVRISVFSSVFLFLVSSAICAQKLPQTPSKEATKLEVNDAVVQAREDEVRLHKLHVKIEGNKLYCNGPWMKSLTTEEFDNIISKFQMNFSQQKLAKINGLHFLADRLQSEKEQLPGFESTIALECQETKLKASIDDRNHQFHIIDGEYQLLVNNDRERVEIFRGTYPFMTYSLKDFRISGSPYLSTFWEKIQQNTTVQQQDEGRYEIKLEFGANRSNRTSSTTVPLVQQIRFNSRTRLIEEWSTYHGGDLTNKSISVGEIEVQVQSQNPDERTSFWFPRYCLAIRYSHGKPSGVRAQRIRSVELHADEELDVTVSAKEGTEIVINNVINNKLRSTSQGKLKNDIDDVVKIYFQRYSDK